MNKVVITKLNNIVFLLIYEEDILVECHPLIQNDSLRIGNIYIGRVEKVVKNIQSAFIRLDEENVGYLPLDETPALILNRTLPKGLPSIAQNDLILVQVTKEPMKMKQARVTGNINLTSAFLSMDLDTNKFGVSKKIKNTERTKELKDLISECEYGLIFRTACENASNELILKEYSIMKEQLEKLISKATYERKVGCIYMGDSDAVSILKQYGLERIDRFVTDLEEYKDIDLGNSCEKEFYTDTNFTLISMLSLNTQIEKLLQKKVWLKSGGFLIIEPTEAMVVIDVNSGKSIGKKNKATHILETNLEAAKEIARQLRLRNLSGMILVDFINMPLETHKESVMNLLINEFKKDKTPTYFVDITKLDLYELTRKKYRKPIYEIINGKEFYFS